MVLHGVVTVDKREPVDVGRRLLAMVLPSGTPGIESGVRYDYVAREFDDLGTCSLGE
jgi:hypothetical protein